MPRPVIIHVQVELAVEFLSVVLVALDGWPRQFGEHSPEGIVVVHLLHRAGLVDYHPVVALVVPQVVVVDGRGAGVNIPLVGKERCHHVVIVHPVSHILHLRGLPIGEVGHAQLVSRRVITVDDAPVAGEGDHIRQI
ncbi:hypothetical protein SDC9_134774 [bioreactor metagenome]|uniref:Uncharacterized protein n=1 Tax=bioreactor metagenome TaxID=1076179 RepID=A0A645DE28_9ZZZZ